MFQTWIYGPLLGLLVLCCAVTSVTAQSFKDKTIRFVFNNSTGGPADIFIRLLAPVIASRIPGSPSAIVEKIASDIISVVKAPAVSQQLTSQGVQIVGMGPQQFAAYLSAEIKKWAAIAKQANMTDMQDK